LGKVLNKFKYNCSLFVRRIYTTVHCLSEEFKTWKKINVAHKRLESESVSVSADDMTLGTFNPAPQKALLTKSINA